MNSNKNFGEYWNNNASIEWYENMFITRMDSHMNIISFIKKYKKNIKSIIEVGGGMGFMLKYFKDLFSTRNYLLIEISDYAVNYCKNTFTNSNHKFLTYNIEKYDDELTKADLVFSTGVVDHVENIELSIEKIAKLSSKYVYIILYYGYHDNIEEHEQIWSNNDTCYYNKCSISKLNNFLESKNYKNINIFKYIKNPTDEKYIELIKNYPHIANETHIIFEV
jgi:hypothetical protein